MVKSCKNCLNKEYNGIRIECFATGQKMYQYDDDEIMNKAKYCQNYKAME